MSKRSRLFRNILFLSTAVLSFVSWNVHAQGVKGGNPQVIDNTWWIKAQPYEKRFHKGRADRPAILLVHGLHQSLASWTKPSEGGGYNYDYSGTPNEITATKDTPGVGIFKVGRSELKSVDQNNWFDFLVSQGFTVGTWSQPGETFADAYPSAEEVFERFVRDTEPINPASPPPIALVGHSRGGLVIRKLLKDKGDMGRVRWVVTLHSPHAGSEIARAPAQLFAEITQLVGGSSLPQPLKGQVKDLALEGARPLNRFMEDGSRELVPAGPLMRGLINGEQPIPGVKYHTFGGVMPNLFKLYAWIFTAGSAVPQYRRDGLKIQQYFKWEARPAEIDLISPILGKVRDFAPEIKVGAGDGLVTDVSSRLPHLGAQHVTTQLHHAEVLWDRRLQQQVVQILLGPSAPVRGIPFPAGRP